MVNVSEHTVVHHQQCGGLAPATVIIRKKRCVEHNGVEEDLRDFKRPTVGLLCKSCISSVKSKCYFAFRGYPSCYLVKG